MDAGRPKARHYSNLVQVQPERQRIATWYDMYPAIQHQLEVADFRIAAKCDMQRLRQAAKSAGNWNWVSGTARHQRPAVVTAEIQDQAGLAQS
jgi:hypothetical protein